MSFHSTKSDYRPDDRGLFRDISSHAVASDGRLLREAGNLLQELHAPVDDVVADWPVLQPGMTEVAIVDSDWTIVAANAAWLRGVADQLGYRGLEVGGNLRRYCERRVLAGFGQDGVLLSGIERIDRGETRQFHYSSRSPETGEQIDTSITMLNTVTGRHGVVSCTNITELRELRLQTRHLARRLLSAQEEERRRVARDLHDTSAQHLVGMSLGLALLRTRDLSPDVSAIVSDLGTLLDQFYRDIRGISFLMHPPMLDRGHLPEAVRLLCDGFAARGALDLKLRIYGRKDLTQSAPEAECAVYRILQEALGNVLKHAKATRVKVRLQILPHLIIVVISDDGIGISFRPESDAGGFCGTSVGIPGMIARITELGGRLSVHGSSRRRGTSVAAAIPIVREG